MTGVDLGAGTVVAVLTYRRTHRLPALLGALVEQAATLDQRAEVLVVDNDPDGSAAGVVRGWAARGVRYVHEPRPGISAARNRALAEAARADVLVFLDDDELPCPGWLARLVGSWRAWGCAAVAGPVSSRLAVPADDWVAGTGVFDRRRETTGALLAGAGAGNLLLDVTQVRRLGLTFDEGLGLVGGEDTLFTHQLVHRGGELRWCDEAEAVESVPADRVTRAWVLRRCFRSAGSWSRAEVSLASGPAGRLALRATLLARAAVRLTQAVLALAAATARRDARARGAAGATLASYAGLVVGALGFVPREYGRVPAAPATGRSGAVAR
ncbi:glycosyltransferase family 2 protein [Geodermatophilus amargosae]|uniref:glycosyltransferase family 2 protein n=1 Tax=Geodermatophilus amargosae TaxID=1296565 RepID=UPI0034DE3D7E